MCKKANSAEVNAFRRHAKLRDALPIFPQLVTDKDDLNRALDRDCKKSKDFVPHQKIRQPLEYRETHAGMKIIKGEHNPRHLATILSFCQHCYSLNDIYFISHIVLRLNPALCSELTTAEQSDRFTNLIEKTKKAFRALWFKRSEPLEVKAEDGQCWFEFRYNDQAYVGKLEVSEETGNCHLHFFHLSSNTKNPVFILRELMLLGGSDFTYFVCHSSKSQRPADDDGKRTFAEAFHHLSYLSLDGNQHLLPEFSRSIFIGCANIKNRLKEQNRSKFSAKLLFFQARSVRERLNSSALARFSKRFFSLPENSSFGKEEPDLAAAPAYLQPALAKLSKSDQVDLLECLDSSQPQPNPNYIPVRSVKDFSEEEIDFLLMEEEAARADHILVQDKKRRSFSSELARAKLRLKKILRKLGGPPPEPSRSAAFC